MFSKKKPRDYLIWKGLKEVYPDWMVALKDTVREVRQVQTALWLSAIVISFSVIVNLILNLEMKPWVRLVVLPGVLIGLVGLYLGIVIAWAHNVVKYRWLKANFEDARLQAATLSEVGDVRHKNFEYIIHKLAQQLISVPSREQNPLSKITFISPLNDNTLTEIKMIESLASDYNLKFEWHITEKTSDRVRLHGELLQFVAESGNTYLTGELPVFEKLLVIPHMTIIGFIENMWFSWNLMGMNLKIDEIKERIDLTPFPRKIKQFFGKEEVHSAISCYLSHVVNMEGFMIGAEHFYLWIEKPDKLFEKFTHYQQDINTKFEEVSDELRPISTHITANLPLVDNYKSIIDDDKIREWLTELKDEADKRKSACIEKGLEVPKLHVDRYIYLQGDIVNGEWDIDNTYLSEVCDFLKKTFFSNLPPNYLVWIILCDRKRLQEEYENWQAKKAVKFPYDEVISNWIWFKCKNSYHVLQYEKGLKVEERVAEALAPVLKKEKSQLLRISCFKFADAVNPDSQEIMKKYQGYKGFLQRCRGTPLVLPFQKFMSKYCGVAEK